MRRRRWKLKWKWRPFNRVPGRARAACETLLLLALLYAIAAAVMLATLPRGAALCWFIIINASIAAMGAVLLAKRLIIGFVLAWLSLPGFLIFFPLGTLAGCYVIVGLVSRDMKRFLARRHSAR